MSLVWVLVIVLVIVALAGGGGYRAGWYGGSPYYGGGLGLLGLVLVVLLILALFNPHMRLLWLALMLAGCGGTENSAGVAPCNAAILIFVSGTADLALDCPATGALKLIERRRSQ